MPVKMHMHRRLGFGFGPKTLWAYKAYFVVSYIFFYKLANYWPSSRALMKGGGAQEKN